MKTYAVILAAGKGTRFGNKHLNKTAVKIGDKSIIQLGIEKLPLHIERIYVVVGHLKETVKDSITDSRVVYVEQHKQLGTADALKQAFNVMKNINDLPDAVLVASGDHLFMTDKQILQRLIRKHYQTKSQATILTTKIRNPENRDNARILRSRFGNIVQILEREQLDSFGKKIKELNTGTYVFEAQTLARLLDTFPSDDPKEFVLTKILFRLGRISSIKVNFSLVGGGVNTQEDLGEYMKSQLKVAIRTVGRKEKNRILIETFILALFLFLVVGKLLFGTNQDVNFLLIYGLTVTCAIWMTFLVSFIFYKDPSELAIAKSKHSLKKPIGPLVSCMVAVHNEEANIGRCIDSMLRQTYSKKEIIVVNDASEDKTLEILKEYEAEHGISVIDLKKNVGKKRALAEAMAVAKGDLYAHTDSDSVWAADVLEKIVPIFQYNHQVGAVSGHGRALNGDKNLLTKIQDSWMEGQFSARKAFESVFGAVTCASGPLAVFRKQAVFNLIPAWTNDKFLGQEFRFATDRTLTGIVLGNKVIGNKIKKQYANSHFVKKVDYPAQKWEVLYCKSAKSWTIVPDTFSKFLKQQVRWKKSFIRNIFFTGSFYWQRPLPVAAVYYLHILFVLIGPYIVFRHLIYLPLMGDLFSGVLYILGITFVGLMFGFAYRLEDDQYSHRWIYRPLMSLLSTTVLSWLIFYSALTIRRMTWSRN